MANNTISQIEINNETYDILDANILNRIYPIGSIYMSVNSTSPASFIGGTWEQLKDRFLLGAGGSYTVNATGGEATHTLTAAESGVPAHGHSHSLKLPNHVHSINSHSHSMNHGHGSDTLYPLNNSVTQSTGGHTSTWSNHRGTNNMLANGDFYGNTGGWSGNTNNPTSLPSITGSVSNNTAANASSAHNNMPPYLAVYMWKRTA